MTTTGMYTAAPTGNEPLTPDDAVNVLEEILEAQNQSYVLGLKLKLPLYIVDSIYEKHSEPRHRLLQVLIEFMKQVNPIPTWRAIVDALRNPVVNLPQLAMRVEAAHFPDPTATDDAPPKTTTSTGIYCLRLTTVFYSCRSFNSSVPRSEATSNISSVASPSTKTSGEIGGHI